MTWHGKIEKATGILARKRGTRYSTVHCMACEKLEIRQCRRYRQVRGC